MAKPRTQPNPAAAQRAALITGQVPPVSAPTTQPLEFIRHEGRHGTRLIRLSSIDQIIYNAGQLGAGPWFVRVGSQEFSIDETTGRALTVLLTGRPSQEVFS